MVNFIIHGIIGLEVYEGDNWLEPSNPCNQVLDVSGWLSGKRDLLLPYIPEWFCVEYLNNRVDVEILEGGWTIVIF